MGEDFAIRSVVSVNIGNYDDIVEEHYPNPKWQFFMFCDEPVKNNLWNVAKIDVGDNPRRQTRLYKWQIHRFIDCEFSLYIDANVHILCDLDKLVDKYLKDADIAMYKHRVRDCLYDEGKACKILKLDDEKTIENQLARYEKQGYPKNYGLSECYVILRRHTPQIAALNNFVWNEIQNGSCRDQLSFNYSAWKLGIKVNAFNGIIKPSAKAKEILEEYFGKEIECINPYFELGDHKKLKIDLGCGSKKKDGYVGIDVFDWSSKYKKGEFICGSLLDVLASFKNDSIEEVYASHFIEHIPQDKVIESMNEIYRVLMPGGLFDILVPSAPGKGAFCDPTHRSFWNDMSFRYYDMDWCRELSVSYGIKCNFKKVKIVPIDENNLHVVLRKA